MDKTEYLFIDAAYLKYRISGWSKYFGGDEIQVDFLKFTENYSKVFYYDGISETDSDKKDILNTLRELPNFHVQTGTIKGVGKKRRQKQVDILIAVDMLMHTIRNNMNSCTLLAGDEDFTPLINALIQEGMNTTIWAEKRSTSKSLLYAADRKKNLSLFDVWKSSTKQFQEKYPVPIINKSTFGSKHRAMYQASMTGKVGDRNVYKVFRDREDILLLIDNGEERGRTDIIVKTEAELSRYLEIMNLEVIWNPPIITKISN